MNHILVYCVLN